MSALIEVERIATEAAQAGREWAKRRADLIIDEKSAGQLASTADLELEKQIRTALQRTFPGDAVIGEEFGGNLGPSTSGWAIDPIDGTSNFLLGLPIWAISIGYVERGVSVLGAVALPEFGLVLSAQENEGLRLNGATHSVRAPLKTVKIIALGENDFETGRDTDARAQTLRDQSYSVVRYRCAVYSLAMSALGKLHGYIENGCGLWDIAAAEIICREAGLNVSTSSPAMGRYFVDARWH
ncbi:MAG: inositol monophosphatase [Pseudomonadota bacterium]